MVELKSGETTDEFVLKIREIVDGFIDQLEANPMMNLVVSKLYPAENVSLDIYCSVLNTWGGNLANLVEIQTEYNVSPNELKKLFAKVAPIMDKMYDKKAENFKYFGKKEYSSFKKSIQKIAPGSYDFLLYIEKIMQMDKCLLEVEKLQSYLDDNKQEYFAETDSEGGGIGLTVGVRPVKNKHK
jgi:hypothetical protein